jgi:hypothetical protein
LWGKNYTRTEPATPAGDDALVEVRDAIRTYFPTEMACAAVVCAILSVMHRREAAAHAAGLEAAAKVADDHAIKGTYWRSEIAEAIRAMIEGETE